MMKKKQTVSRWLPLFTIAFMSLMAVSCTGGDEQDITHLNFNAPSGTAVYEGEWTVNKQVVDTARLVVDTSLHLRLPESYLLGLCQQSVMQSGSIAAPLIPQGVVTDIQLLDQGYSEQAQYMTFASSAYQGIDKSLRYVACSFSATVGDVPYLVSLVSTDNANAVMQYDTDQWTLGIPLTALVLTQMATGETIVCELPVTTHLFYTTKRRVS